MTILAVTEDDRALAQITEMITESYPDAELMCFGSGLPALAAARTHEIDIGIIDISLSELSGLDFGQYLIDLYPFVNIIYVSENGEHAYAAIQQHASGYMIKPVSADRVKRELEDLRHPEVQKKQKRLFAQTFGNFDLFVDGKPVVFKYTKTKEIVAILINNRGAQTSNGEIIACLWEDDGDPEKKASYLSNLRQDLQNTFHKLKLNGIILKQRGSLAIAADKIECDLYDWLENKLNSRYQYLGDYMNQYSWPEVVHAELDEINYALHGE